MAPVVELIQSAVAAAQETRAEGLQLHMAYLRTWWRSSPGTMCGGLQSWVKSG